ncbi:hypothetical protein D8B26_008262 [Coccidioides posadasii str. Silveira]|uniref:uncharacterized protein n=1 Tax=Coccidioides posadasii (strain RMSCC 757 / Silveira) TaxID=443226 RepID=UPI001BF02EEF|nr:hypothetical protein D8B26_008262 [Coccidioides posadasii str. Silveira]
MAFELVLWISPEFSFHMTHNMGRELNVERFDPRQGHPGRFERHHDLQVASAKPAEILGPTKLNRKPNPAGHSPARDGQISDAGWLNDRMRRLF